MFRRKHHQIIGDILRELNGDLLRDRECYFGGGTATALLKNEYRESVDMDFLVSNKEHYRELRNLLTDKDGIFAIAKEGARFTLAREIRADQYGIRTAIQLGGVLVKFEVVLEGRIEFEIPTDKDCIEGITTLTKLDLLTSKLLANSDRWNDEAIYSRDIIDLVMLSPSKTELIDALAKASKAYGDSVRRDLDRAINRLFVRDGHLEKCMTILKMEMPKALLWQRFRDLQNKL